MGSKPKLAHVVVLLRHIMHGNKDVQLREEFGSAGPTELLLALQRNHSRDCCEHVTLSTLGTTIINSQGTRHALYYHKLGSDELLSSLACRCTVLYHLLWEFGAASCCQMSSMLPITTNTRDPFLHIVHKLQLL